MPETPSASEALSPSRAMTEIPRAQLDRREEFHSSALDDSARRQFSVNRISERVFLRIELTPELDAFLADLAGDKGYDEMMRSAFGLLKIAQEARRENKRLVVIDDE